MTPAGVGSISAEEAMQVAALNRQELYELAKERRIPGRSKMGKWELIDATRKSR